MPNQTLYDNFSQIRQYIDQEKPDLSSYVSKSELAEMGYISSIPVKYPTLTGFTIPSGATEIKFRSGGLNIDDSTYDLYPTNITYSSAASQSNRTWVGMGTLKNYVDGRIAEIESSYATTSYVVDYVAEHGGGGSTVIDENLIPNTNNTYTLGNSSNYYKTSYAKNVYVDNTIKFWQASSGELDIDLSGVTKYFFNPDRFAPSTANNHNKLDLGKSDRSWKTTYTQSLYLDGTNIEDRFTYLIWTGTSAEYAALPDYTTYQIYLIEKDAI